MIGKSALAFALCLGTFGYQIESHAALIDNGITTLQTSNGLEWLDLSATQGLSISAILGGAGGYVNDGWQFASFSQVSSLFSEAGAAPSQTGGFTSNPAVIAAAQNLNLLLGTLSSNTFYPSPLVFLGSTGFALSDDGSFASQFVYQVAENGSSARLWDTSTAYQWYPSVWNATNPSIGNYLVRPTSVPEPTTLSLMLLGLVGVVGLRKRTA